MTVLSEARNIKKYKEKVYQLLGVIEQYKQLIKDKDAQYILLNEQHKEALKALKYYETLDGHKLTQDLKKAYNVQIVLRRQFQEMRDLNRVLIQGLEMEKALNTTLSKKVVVLERFKKVLHAVFEVEES